jgi:hypothetical protein
VRVVATDYLADPLDLAIWLGKPVTDLKLLAALGAASRRFRGAVGHSVGLVTGDAVTLDGNGRESVLLPATHVVAVSQVLLDDEELVEGSGFSWSENGYLRRLGCGRWPDRLRCIEVTYDHGYAVIPEDIQEVVIDQARAMFTVVPGVQSRAVGGQSVTFGAQASVGVSDQWSRAVTRYKLRVGGDA